MSFSLNRTLSVAIVTRIFAVSASEWPAGQNCVTYRSLNFKKALGLHNCLPETQDA